MFYFRICPHKEQNDFKKSSQGPGTVHKLLLSPMTFLHFSEKETEIQRKEASFSRSHSKEGAKLVFDCSFI